MIREMRREEIPVCVEILRKSFQTVADEFGFTKENSPYFVAFSACDERLIKQLDEQHRPMFVYEKDGVLCGYYNLLMQENNECELGSLSVLPEYRHKGIGKELLMHSLDQARRAGCKTLNLSIVEENQVLRRWYEANGAEHLYTKKFDFFAFTVGYMKIAL